MPELPEVELLRKKISGKATGKKISGISRDKSRIFQVSESTLRRHLTGNKFDSVYRRGKYLFFQISNGYFLVLHFGMTGELEYFKGKEPEFSRLVVCFSEGHKLAYTSIRKLGKVYIVKDRGNFINEKKLGPDALRIKKREFLTRMEGKRGIAKTALMDQSLVSGIGNVYSDEILYQAGISPFRKIKSLGRKRLGEVYKTMKRVLKTAVRKNGERKEFPLRYLIGRRREGEKCGICSGKIKNREVGGRSCYYCPEHQK